MNATVHQWRGSARANVLGVGVHAIDMVTAVDEIESAVASGRRGYVCVTGVHGVMEAQRNPTLAGVLQRALLVTPDGMPTVWVGRLQGFRNMQRVFGPELMLELCAKSVRGGFTHFLYGGKPGVAEELRTVLETMFPGIRIVGTYTPPFRPLNAAEQAELARIFETGKPDITWVGLSTPKQELFMAEYINRLNTTVMIGVGAAFDVHTGRLRDAPRWVKQAGLQWVHRLLQEPHRLWKRYLRNNPNFLWLAGLQFAGLRRFDLAEPSLRQQRQPKHVGLND